MNRTHPNAMLLIEFRNGQHEVVYRNTTPTGIEAGQPTFVIGVHPDYPAARRHFDTRKGARVVGTWSDGCVARMAALDRALDKLEVR